MSAYSNHYWVEEQRQQIFEDTLQREQWICDRAEELKAKWPEDLTTLTDPYQFRSLPGVLLDDAQDAYADLVHRICTAQAEKDWTLREFLGAAMFGEIHQ